jgi:CMP-N,N'-diacetyllegionaminic acid synthase
MRNGAQQWGAPVDFPVDRELKSLHAGKGCLFLTGLSHSAAGQVLAIIPARGGSKRLPRKNLLPLAGRPLIEYTLQAALSCPDVARTAVTSDDPETLELALKWGVEAVERPASLASDDARMEDVILHALDQLERRASLPPLMTVLQPTSPLRTAEHLGEAIALYLASAVSSLASVTPAYPHPLKTFRLEGAELYPLRELSDLSANYHRLPAYYTTNGAIYVVRTALFRREGSFFVPPLGHYLMPRSVSTDIDDRLDFDLCSLILAK